MLLIRRVGDRHNIVPHYLSHLQREMAQAANSDYRNAITRLRLRRAKGAHRGEASAEKGSSEFPVQAIWQ